MHYVGLRLVHEVPALQSSPLDIFLKRCGPWAKRGWNHYFTLRVLLNQWALANCCSVKFMQEGCKKFQNDNNFWYRIFQNISTVSKIEC